MVLHGLGLVFIVFQDIVMFLVCFSIKTLVSLALGSSMENLASPSSPGTPPPLLGWVNFSNLGNFDTFQQLKFAMKAISTSNTKHKL